MKLPVTLGVLTLGTTAVFLGQMNSDAVAARSGSGGDPTPDVIVGDIHDRSNHGSRTVNGKVIRAYSIGTNSCNIGNDYLTWDANTNQHPTIGGTAWRIVEFPNGSSRIEHIGRAWLKHGFCALQYTLCGSCSNPGGGGCADRLGWNCSDPYSASLNGQQSNLGPRDEVNPTTGYFQYPPGGGSYQSTIGRRLQIREELLSGAEMYIVEGTYVHPDDAAACRGENNSSWREVTFSGSNYNMNLQGTTKRTENAIFAWEAYDQNVRVERYDYGPCNETFYYGVSVGENSDGTWQYNYVFYNHNLNEALGSLEIPHAGGTVSDVEQIMCAYTDGDYGYTDWDDQDTWLELTDGNSIRFSTDDYSVNQNAHAIHWQSAGTFSFTSTLAPVSGEVVVGIHKNGDTVTVQTTVPGGEVEPPSECELNDVNQDGVIDGTDLSLVLGFWGKCGSCPADVSNDGMVDGTDLSVILGYWGCTWE